MTESSSLQPQIQQHLAQEAATKAQEKQLSQFTEKAKSLAGKIEQTALQLNPGKKPTSTTVRSVSLNTIKGAVVAERTELQSLLKSVGEKPHRDLKKQLSKMDKQLKKLETQIARSEISEDTFKVECLTGKIPDLSQPKNVQLVQSMISKEMKRAVDNHDYKSAQDVLIILSLLKDKRIASQLLKQMNSSSPELLSHFIHMHMKSSLADVQKACTSGNAENLKKALSQVPSPLLKSCLVSLG